MGQTAATKKPWHQALKTGETRLQFEIAQASEGSAEVEIEEE